MTTSWQASARSRKGLRIDATHNAPYDNKAMRAVFSWMLLSLVMLTGCDPVSGEGTLVFTNRHRRCTVKFSLNDDSDHSVAPGRTIRIKDVPAGGTELIFTALPDDCVLYTRQHDSPFDSGRNLCNAFIEPDKETKFVAVEVDRPGFDQINVICP